MSEHINSFAMICLGFIMIEVGLDFTINKNDLKRYGWDYIVAGSAAAFPWIFCALYFIAIFKMEWRDALLIGRFAAPTSAGILFAMLIGAGLGATWLFHKARILAIFDDLDTILFLIPLQMMCIGFNPQLLFAVCGITIMLFAAYHWLHVIRLPNRAVWYLCYSIIIVFLTEIIEETTHIKFEVLLPAFVFGCILFNPPHKDTLHDRIHKSKGHRAGLVWPLTLDSFIKGLFMFLVGCSLPKIYLGNADIKMLIIHVCLLTILINLGKCFVCLCYRREASLRERLALGIAMFPRGEVGAGVLLLALKYEITGFPTTVAILCLALNLILSGVFITAVIFLIKPGHLLLLNRKQ
jgi:Kef-type K+ transport system membrane component KefB